MGIDLRLIKFKLFLITNMKFLLQGSELGYVKSVTGCFILKKFVTIMFSKIPRTQGEKNQIILILIGKVFSQSRKNSTFDYITCYI